MTLAAPSSMTRSVAEHVAAARSSRRPLRVAGAGSWLDAGRPVSAHDKLSLASTRGILEYVPGDLTMTVAAGTTLAQIATTLDAEHQWLPLDPHGSDAGTIGATVATNSSGPLAHAFGAPRDQVLGLEFVDGTGTVARGGGRVVKNVAGFDLTRLLIGSWGTLGIITEVSLRLRARPEVDSTVALALPDDGTKLRDLLGQLSELRIAPYALEMVNRSLAGHLELGAQSTLLARFGGNADVVRAQTQTLSTLGDLRGDVAGTVWQRLRACDSGSAVVVRLSERPSRMDVVWKVAGEVAGESGFVHASPGRGIARVVIAAEPTDEPLTTSDLQMHVDGVHTAVYERLPAIFWPAYAANAIHEPLSRRLKATFDPDRILNPGIFGELAA